VRILIVGVDYSPDVAGIAPYTAGLAEELATLGHDISVVTTFPHYPRYRWSEPEGVRFPWRDEMYNGVRIRRVWTLLPRRNQAAWRIAFDTCFALFAFLAAVMWSGRADAVVSVCVPAQVGIVGGILARLRNADSIFWVKDLPVEAAISTGLLPGHGWVPRVGKAVEAIACRMNQVVVVISDGFASYVQDLGGHPVLIPDWAPSAPGAQVTNNRTSIRRELGVGAEDFLLIHAGNIGEKQGLDTFLSSLMGIDAKGLQILIIGRGSSEERVRRAASGCAFPVTFMDFVAPERLMAMMQAADALLLAQLAAVTRSVVPSKLLTYLASGTPVLAVVNAKSSAADLVTRSGAGVVADPAHTGDVIKKLSAMIRMSRSERADVGALGPLFVSRNFSRVTIVSQWVSLLSRTALTNGLSKQP